MYITYEIPQCSLYREKGTNEVHKSSDSKIPDELLRPDFMPAKLLRISDMEVVDGAQVNEGYCALSYSWNQSGEVDYSTEKATRTDEGKHEIIFYDIPPHMIISQYDSIEIHKRWKIDKVLKIMDKNNYYFQKTIKYVKFEGIIQEICQQFNIKYIWYDQMCINQNNKEEKQREIRNMHHIYENAYCTVALVPEFDNDQECLIGIEEYFKRLWTLEEAIKSKKVLFIGKNIYRWGFHIREYGPAFLLSNKTSELRVNDILHYAHRRTSTKEHDRVFALINLFPEFIDKIKIDYDQPFEELLIQFYILLAKKDISILAFKKAEEGVRRPSIQKYQYLPSWTGVNGLHIRDNNGTPFFQNYSVIGRTMHVTSIYIPSKQIINGNSLTLRKEDLPPPLSNLNDYDLTPYYNLYVLGQLPGSSKTQIIKLNYYYSRYQSFSDVEESLRQTSKQLQQLSRFMEIKKENLFWCHEERDDVLLISVDIDFRDLTEDLNDSTTQYAILSEICFKIRSSLNYYPIIKKKQGEKYYTAIGCCHIRRSKTFFSDCNLPKQTFLIQ